MRRLSVLPLFVLAALVPLHAQKPSDAPRIEAQLSARFPEGRISMRWSPKGAKVALRADGEALVGSFALGQKGLAPVQVRLEKLPGAEHFERLCVDVDRDGKLSDGEWLRCKASERRGKWWSSFQATLTIPMPIPRALGREAPAELAKMPAARPYPVSLWFVVDPREPDAPLSLRWSRRGWHQGQVDIAGKPAFVLVTEMSMDGVLDRNDAWELARSEKELLAASSRSMQRHAWLDGQAYRVVDLDAHGRRIVFEPFDPGRTKEEEERQNDRTFVDRQAPMAKQPLAFGHDYAMAMAQAKKAGKRVFLDFETTWCGPCKAMDRIVYTKQPVVAAAKGVIAVKLDGDEQRALVKQYDVKGYPTLILLAADGKEIRRAVGYQGVQQMQAFLR